MAQLMIARSGVRKARVIGAVALALSALAALVACGPNQRSASGDGGGAAPAAVPVGQSAQTITVDGRSRAFHLYRPASASPAGPMPLVVMLHGGFGNGTQAEQAYGWDAEAAREHFLVAYPDGIDRAWNVGGGCCGKPGRDNVDDVAFVSAMVGALQRELPIDPARIYATGISNGGMMAYRLACDSRLFAAIGPDSATLLGGCPAPAPASVIHIHGTADHNIRFQGGQGDGFAKINGPPVPAVIAGWRAADHCGPPAETDQPPVTRSVSNCPDGRAVELITIAGAGHQWPGGADKPLLRKLLGTDQPSAALDATSVIWTFFAAHPKPAR